jgi:hypothetical protein
MNDQSVNKNNTESAAKEDNYAENSEGARA